MKRRAALFGFAAALVAPRAFADNDPIKVYMDSLEKMDSIDMSDIDETQFSPEEKRKQKEERRRTVARLIVMDAKRYNHGVVIGMLDMTRDLTNDVFRYQIKIDRNAKTFAHRVDQPTDLGLSKTTLVINPTRTKGHTPLFGPIADFTDTDRAMPRLEDTPRANVLRKHNIPMGIPPEIQAKLDYLAAVKNHGDKTPAMLAEAAAKKPAKPKWNPKPKTDEKKP